MTPLNRPCARALALALLCLAAPAVSAQDLLVMVGAQGSRNIGTNQNLGQDLGPAPFVGSQDALFGGGRYSALGFGNDAVARDIWTGASWTVSGFLVALDRARPRLFVARQSGIWRFDVPTGLEASVWSGDGTLVQQCALAESPNRLYCALSRLDGRSDVIGIDVATATATPLAVLQLAPATGGGFGWSYGTQVWNVTSDGARLYFVTSGAVLAMLRTATGQVTTSSLGYNGWFASRIRLDERNQRVFVIGVDSAGGSSATAITVLSADLAVIGSGDLPASCNNLVVSPHTGHLYLAQFPFDSCPGSCGGRLTLRKLDSATYAPIGAPVLTAGAYRNNECAFMAVFTAPGAPRDLTASVVGRDVGLTWTNVGAASGFVLDVGFAPGRTDLQVYLGPDAQFAAQAVPPGVYYLRVRGANGYGGGRPSNEIRLVVP